MKKTQKAYKRILSLLVAAVLLFLTPMAVAADTSATKTVRFEYATDENGYYITLVNSDKKGACPAWENFLLTYVGGELAYDLLPFLFNIL